MLTVPHLLTQQHTAETLDLSCCFGLQAPNYEPVWRQLLQFIVKEGEQFIVKEGEREAAQQAAAALAGMTLGEQQQ
jgi:hypothetical protein